MYFQLLETVQQNIPRYKTSTVNMLYDNCSAQPAKITQEKISKLRWKILKHHQIWQPRTTSFSEISFILRHDSDIQKTWKTI